MFTAVLRAMALISLQLYLFAVVFAQTAPLPDTAPVTSPLPVEQPTAPVGEGDVANPEDASVTPPPSTEVNLPASTQRTSLMVRRGDKELEWRTSYSHFSKSTVFVEGVAMLPVMVIGEVGVERTRKDLLITSAAFRYGLLDNLEGEVKVPFRYQHERRAIPDTDPPQEITVDGAGLGDIEGSLIYQLPRKSEEDTRWIANVQLKSATGRDTFEINTDQDVPLGTGFWSTRVGLSGVRIADPAAIYWNFGYAYNWERKNIRVVIEDKISGDQSVSYVNVKPGNTLEFGGGFAYALNQQLSVNTGVNISFNQSTTANGNRLSNTALTSASLRMGTVWVTRGQLPIDLSVSIGLTDDSPDFTLEFRQNYKL